MTTLVVGATGATGRLLVKQLLAQGEKVKIIVRSVDDLSDLIKKNDQLIMTEASLLEMTDAELFEQVQGCRAVASCLGHNLTFKGMFGQPRRLVTDAVQRLCCAIEKTTAEVPVKFILMNTTGNQNTLAGEKVSSAQSIVVGLIRHLLPPHADNETAAAYLQSSFGTHQKRIEWVAVRPDSLINEESVTDYDVYASPIRSAIFDAGKTSRINVAHFISQLIINDNTWEKWKRQMPVIYNAAC
ncbi:NAD(P)-dependent oxidoreductase [Motiliproteus sp. MSK22-1]|uniref:NAD(P)-dependent oxidoreductase n=1 Tax=Motiliproteus sp. MSK22-1 TaxID=1897630 RepID=UPI000975C35B|nr:NAD(P)-binding oxidoreductase [Motiliproteus sp. MSK22-1]OMH39321.1 NAD-dependent epimerase [Motiliproteus sp. MSK22-1]